MLGSMLWRCNAAAHLPWYSERAVHIKEGNAALLVPVAVRSAVASGHCKPGAASRGREAVFLLDLIVKVLNTGSSVLVPQGAFSGNASFEVSSLGQIRVSGSSWVAGKVRRHACVTDGPQDLRKPSLSKRTVS